MIGTVLGIVAGHYLLSRIIAQIVTSDTTLGETHLYFYWNYTAIALLLALISAVLPAFLIAKNELSENQHSCCYLSHLSKVLKFSWNVLELSGAVYHSRISYCAQYLPLQATNVDDDFGVAGSVALLFAGLGIRSSLGNVIENQFTNLMPYDMIVVKKR